MLEMARPALSRALHGRAIESYMEGHESMAPGRLCMIFCFCSKALIHRFFSVSAPLGWNHSSFK